MWTEHCHHLYNLLTAILAYFRRRRGYMAPPAQQSVVYRECEMSLLSTSTLMPVYAQEEYPEFNRLLELEAGVK